MWTSVSNVWIYLIRYLLIVKDEFCFRINIRQCVKTCSFWWIPCLIDCYHIDKARLYPLTNKRCRNRTGRRWWSWWKTWNRQNTVKITDHHIKQSTNRYWHFSTIPDSVKQKFENGSLNINFHNYFYWPKQFSCQRKSIKLFKSKFNLLMTFNND